MAASDLISLDRALDIITAEARDVLAAHPPDLRRVSIWEASGLVLAEDIHADRDQPAFDRAMMDGFAVAAAGIPAEGATLDVVATLPAGSRLPFEAGFALGPGQAAAIMTGAAMPQGADAVAIVEDCRRDGDRVHVPGPIQPGANVTHRGALVRAGAVVVERGRTIESLTAGVLGTVGAAEFLVYRRPRVTVIATGDELVNIDEEAGPEQIRDSNRRAVMALAESEWCRVVDGGIVGDERIALREAIREGLESDVLVLSGGVSRGDFDLVAGTLESEGVDILFHRIALKPGKPLLFGRRGRSLVFGLPGNPVSTWVTAALCLAPALRILGHRPEHRNWQLNVPLIGTLPVTGGRTTIHPGHLFRNDAGDLRVQVIDWRGSSDHLSYARANALIRCEPGASAVAEGARVRVILPNPTIA
jgi:molybdopterin molybdotransferase